jgi:hypothetical protein
MPAVFLEGENPADHRSCSHRFRAGDQPQDEMVNAPRDIADYLGLTTDVSHMQASSVALL